MTEDNRKYSCDCEFEDYKIQPHVHEFEGSTKIAQRNEDPHNHRFAGVSSEPIPEGKSHVHEVLTNTDFYEDHHHTVGGRSGPAIEVGDGRHVHFAHSITSLQDGHVHKFEFAAQIDNPIGEKDKKSKKCE